MALTREEISEQVRKELSDFLEKNPDLKKVEPEDIIETAPLRGEYGMDSLDNYEWGHQLEEHFGIYIPDPVMDAALYPQDFIGYIHKNQ